jgi:polar amino acid transport system substrate-binding protein
MKSMKKIILMILLFISTSASVFAEETIRLTNGEWPPWLSKDLKHYGLASHIVTEAFALEGVKVEYGFFPWKRAYQIAERGEWDGTAIWSKAPEREERFYYSDPVLYGTLVFFHLKSYEFDWNTIEDLKGIKIGATLQYTYGKEFDNAAKAGVIKVDYMPTDEQNYNKLLLGRIDIFPMERDVGYNMLRKNLKPEQVKLFTHHPKPIRSTSFHLLLPKKLERSKRMLVLFNKGLKRLREMGKIDQFIASTIKGEYLQE